MRAEVAAHAPHARKHGATFAEVWTLADRTTIVAVGAVLAGADPFDVSDLVRTGARAVVTSSRALARAIAALDRIVSSHAREHRDDALAVAFAVVSVPPSGSDIAVAGAGPLHAALFDSAGTPQPIHARAPALGTGSELGDATPLHLHRDDLVVVSTMAVPASWWSSGDRTPRALLHPTGTTDAAAAVIGSG